MQANVISEYSTKSDLLYTHLKEQIIDGVLRPGERLVVLNVANEFHVSPMPVREAFQRLQQDGLITMTPHVGAKVISLDMQSFKEIISIRNELEPMAARLAATEMNDEQINELFRLTEKMEACAGVSDARLYSKLNQCFHGCIYQGCGNHTLCELIESLQAKTERSRSIFMRDPDRMVTSANEHRQIAQCIRERNPEATYQAFRSHKEKGFDIIIRMLSEEAGV